MALRKDDINISLNISWSEEDQGYVVKSKQYPNILGVATTKEEAITIFYDHLEAWQDYERQNKTTKKAGRPKKNNTRLDINIKKETKIDLELLGLEKNINLGSLIDEMVVFYKQYRHLDN